MTLTRFGFHFSSTTYDGWTSANLFTTVKDVARAAEDSGFDSLWVPDHTQQNSAHKTNAADNSSAPMIEAYTLLAALAGVTTHVRLGSLATPVTFRNPAWLAKIISSLDVVSGGRAVLGLGTGWDEEEHKSYGIQFPAAARERADRLVEALDLCRALMDGGPATLAGQYFKIEDAWNSPTPIQARVPVVIAGGGERVTLPLVARYADACNFFGTPEEIKRKFDVLQEQCDIAGRDYHDITKTVGFVPPTESRELQRMVDERLAVGVDGIILFAVSSPPATQVAEWGRLLTRVNAA